MLRDDNLLRGGVGVVGRLGNFCFREALAPAEPTQARRSSPVKCSSKHVQFPDPTNPSSHVPRDLPLFATPHVSVIRGAALVSPPPSGQRSHVDPKYPAWHSSHWSPVKPVRQSHVGNMLAKSSHTPRPVQDVWQ